MGNSFFLVVLVIISSIVIPFLLTFYSEIKKKISSLDKITRIVLIVSVIIVICYFLFLPFLKDFGSDMLKDFSLKHIPLEEGAPEINITILNISQPIYPDRTYCEKKEDCIVGCCGGCENNMAKPANVVRNCMCLEGYTPAIGCECVNNTCRDVHAKS